MAGKWFDTTPINLEKELGPEVYAEWVAWHKAVEAMPSKEDVQHLLEELGYKGETK